MRDPGAAIVVLGAGSGSRVGAGVNKVLLPLGDRPVLAHALIAALEVSSTVVLVVRDGEQEAVSTAIVPHLAPADEVLMVPGGSTRHESEQAALTVLAPRVAAGEVDVVAIHDGARPLASPTVYAEVLAAARTHGGAIPVAPLTGLLRLDGTAVPPGLAGVQTPQAFRADVLLDAYARAAEDGFEGTDTASCLERYHPEVRIAAVSSTPRNLKITYPADVGAASALL